MIGKRSEEPRLLAGLENRDLLRAYFHEMFRPVVRCLFDWDRFMEEKWPVGIVIATTMADLYQWVLPWYVDKTGKIVNYDAAGAEPIRANNAGKHLGSLSFERQNYIQSLASQMRQQRHLVQVVVPAYYCDGHYLLMDGTRRVCALALNAMTMRFNLVGLVIQGPTEESIYADLHYWIQQKVNPQV